ncbi:hypothetical protein [Bradyrhizobium sp. 170]|uniref:hypothetical protein n=1 Tax=Bradyrhizobium sp. 170 TaxID=2782641 RepID=UPI001FFFF01A|nr:hypothetical protein [Bradyrhizobium sp. 170]UPK02205.1 hypothetical protein IVB05_31985 [Bradyrhizobium sp. 170]
MRFPRWFEPTYVWLWPFASSLISGSRLLEWLTTGQLRVSSFFENLDHYVSQEPVFLVFGFVTMSVMMVATLIAIVVLYVED